MNTKIMLLLATVSTVLCSSISLAQNPVLEEITVTAQKRVESLQDVPISVATASGDKIENQGIDDLQELSFVIPNVTITQEQISDRINIRGIASGGNQGFDQSVGLFSNGVYLAKGTQFRSAFLDVDAVEVLRGPQATLFGKNTIAGAVSITPRRPDFDFSAGLRGNYETKYGDWSTSGFINGGLSETFAARAAFKVSENDGYVVNKTANRDEPASESNNFRLSLLWQPTENLSANLTHEAFSLDQDGKAFEIIAAEVLEAGTGNVLQSGDAACTAYNLGVCGLDYEVYATNVASVGDTTGFSAEDFSEVDTDLTTLHIQYQMGDYAVTSVTGISNSEVSEINSAAGLPYPTTNTAQHEEFESFSQEIRIASPSDADIVWLAGVYYETNEYDLSETIFVNDYFALGPFVTGSPGAFLTYNPTVVQKFSQESDTWAIFAQTTWKISDSFRTTLGLRYGDEEKNATQSYAHTLPGAPYNLDLAFGAENHAVPKQTYQEDDISPSVNVQWDATDDLMIYASWSIGYKSGGFDARLANDGTRDRVIDTVALLEEFQFEQEKATTRELGFKSTLADGAAELNGTFFSTKYEDLQYSTFTGGLAFEVDNAAEVDLTGFEFEGRWQLSENFLVSGGGAWLDFDYADFKAGPCTVYQQTAAGGALASCTQDLTGKTGTNTPEFSANASLDWTNNISDTLELALNATVSYEDSFYVAPDLDPLLKQDAYSKLNLRAALNSTDDKWSVAVIAKNVTDETTFHYGTDVPLVSGVRFVRTDAPRMVTVEGVIRF